MKPLVLGIKAAGEAVGVKRSSIYALVRRGRLKAIKVGARTLITVESLERLVTDAQQVPEAAIEAPINPVVSIAALERSRHLQGCPKLPGSENL